MLGLKFIDVSKMVYWGFSYDTRACKKEDIDCVKN